MTRYNILYRGPLSSCNYGCDYCPFAKREETYAELEPDRVGLSRFVNWIKSNTHRNFGVLFTPWGEALVRKWYCEAMVELSHLPHIERVACQTNLSCSLDWMRQANRRSFALWATFHPTETDLESFIRKVKALDEWGIRLSVGVVGLKEHFEQIEKLRSSLPSSVYVWVNAFKRKEDYYQTADLDFLKQQDPLFAWNNERYHSLAEECFAGESSFTVDGEGTMRRCHFIDASIGNIADLDWEKALRPRLCTNETCSCHIGYVHLKRLRLYSIYGSGLLERIPEVS